MYMQCIHSGNDICGCVCVNFSMCVCVFVSTDRFASEIVAFIHSSPVACK